MLKRLLVLPLLLVAPACLPTVAAPAPTPSTSGDALADDGNYSAAAQAFGAALKQAPDRADLLAKLARVDLLLGKSGPAVKTAEQAIDKAPRNAKYQLLLGDALSAYVNDVSIFHKLGIAHRLLAAYQRAVQLAPDDADAHFALAMFYAVAPGIAGGSAAQAATQVQWLTAHGDPAQADLVRAHQTTGAKHYATAEALYRKAAASAKDSSGYVELGEFLVSRKQPGAALAAFRKATTAYPHQPDAYYAIGKLASKGQADAKAGIAALDAYLGMPVDWQDGDAPRCWAHYRLGQIHARTGQAGAARAEYQRALKLDPGFRQATQALAKLGPA